MSKSTYICHRCYNLFHNGEVKTVGLSTVAICALCSCDLDHGNNYCVSHESVERIKDALWNLLIQKKG